MFVAPKTFYQPIVKRFMKYFIKAILFAVSSKAKKWSLLALCLGFFATGFSQESAYIEYKQTVYARKMLPPDQMQYAMMIPEKMEAKVELRYHKNIASIEEKAIESDGSVAISMGNGGKSFFDLEHKKKLTLYPKSAMIAKNFAVESEIDEAEEEIKHTGKTMEIMGYQCKEITFEMDMEGLGNGNVTVTAYYTDEIPYGHSPMGYMGLSGTLLKLECEYFIYTVVEVHKEKQDIVFAIPADYKKITEEQFEDIMDEAMEGTGF